MLRSLLALPVLSAMAVSLPACRSAADCLPEIDWGAVAAGSGPSAASLLAGACAQDAPPALVAWWQEEGAGRSHLAVPGDLQAAWAASCGSLPAAEVGAGARGAALRKLAGACALPAGFGSADELVVARGNPVLALVTRGWLLSAGAGPDSAEAVAEALRGPPPWPQGETVALPAIAAGTEAAAATAVLSKEGAVRGVADAQPLGAGPGGWAVAAWRGTDASDAAAVIAADAAAPAQDLVRLVATLTSPGASARVLGIVTDAAGEQGVGAVELAVPSGPGTEPQLAVTAEGLDVWRGGLHVPPVAGCAPEGVTMCRAAESSPERAGLAEGQPVRLSVAADLRVADLLAWVSALGARKIPVVLDLSDSPCAPAPEGMRCVAGGPTPVGAPGAADNPGRMLRLSTFYADRGPVGAVEYQACADAGFCPPSPSAADGAVTNLGWEAADRFCTWSGKQLPTEWQWEKMARTDPAVADRAQWTRTWMAPVGQTARDSTDPLGPCAGSEPCDSAVLRVRRGGGAAISERTALSPGSRTGAVLRCVIPGAEGQDPPPYLARGSESRSPVRTRLPAAQIARPWPELGLPAAPTPAELQAVTGLEFDNIDDKPVCGEEKVVTWNFASGVGGRSDLDCRDPVSYIDTNEKRLTTFLPWILNIGGAYAGVGAAQNYDLIALARSRWAFLFDYEPNVVRLHRVLEALILASDSPAAFVDRFSPGSVDQSLELIKRQWSSDPQMSSYQRLFLGYQARLLAIYTRQLAAPVDDPRFGWLAHEDQYGYVRTLYQQGRIVILPGDMLARRSMLAIGAAATRLGVPIRIFYTSNAPTSWGGNITPEWRANVGALPFDDDSVVLVTWNHGAFGQVDYWHYNVQRALTYQSRLLRPEYRYMWQLAWDRIPGGDPDLTVTGIAGGP